MGQLSPDSDCSLDARGVLVARGEVFIISLSVVSLAEVLDFPFPFPFERGGQAVAFVTESCMYWPTVAVDIDQLLEGRSQLEDPAGSSSISQSVLSLEAGVSRLTQCKP